MTPARPARRIESAREHRAAASARESKPSAGLGSPVVSNQDGNADSPGGGGGFLPFVLQGFDDILEIVDCGDHAIFGGTQLADLGGVGGYLDCAETDD